MKVCRAREIAVRWVKQEGSRTIGYRGAYFCGSTIELPDDAELQAASDIDVFVVVERDDEPMKLGKFIYEGVLLEVTFLPVSLLSSVEDVLTSYHLAGGFRIDTIIDDPTGHLRMLQQQVSRNFAKREWVERRCLNVRKKIEDGIRAFDTSKPLHDKVTSWLFPAGVTCHLILVAALRNPTVRLRYLAARDVLHNYGYTGVYQRLLELLGCASLTPEQAAYHLKSLEKTFDAAAAVSKTPFPFSTDITPASRQIAIDGSQELIRAGNHREAVFWIIATYARCHKILAADAPQELQLELLPTFKAAVAELGIISDADLIERGKEVIEYLPVLWDTAELIMSANPSIVQH